MKNGRFFVGLVGVAAVVGWLMWTGISDSMVYYLTPVELIERGSRRTRPSTRWA